MSTIRKEALNTMRNRPIIPVTAPSQKISDIYGTNVFNQKAMREFLAEDVYKSLLNTIEHGGRIEGTIADQVAAGMKNWAMTKGATHYTHWFQPLTGATAEKHDAFFSLQLFVRDWLYCYFAL